LLYISGLNVNKVIGAAPQVYFNAPFLLESAVCCKDTNWRSFQAIEKSDKLQAKQEDPNWFDIVPVVESSEPVRHWPEDTLQAHWLCAPGLFR